MLVEWGIVEYSPNQLWFRFGFAHNVEKKVYIATSEKKENKVII